MKDQNDERYQKDRNRWGRHSRRLRPGAALALLSALALLVFGLVGCGGGTDSKGGATGTDGKATSAVDTTLRYGLTDEPGTLDAAFAYDYVVNPVTTQITEGLLKYDHDDQLQPYLCESWEEVDPLTYVYNVKQNVKFSDGTPLTMEDVLFSVERYRDPKVASFLRWMYDNVDTVKQTGDWQFTVKLKQADALWKHTFATTAGHIHNKAFVEKAGENYGKPAGKILGTGPYVLADWKNGSQITLKYNPEYWDSANLGEPDIKQINYLFMPEDAARALALSSGQIDLDTQLPAEKMEEIKNNPKTNLITFPSGGLHFLAFNCQKKPFTDVNVRRAIESAIDVTQIQANIIKDAGVATNYISVPESMMLFEQDKWKSYEETCKKYTFDLAAAKKYLAASAYAKGFETELLVDDMTMSNSIALFIQQSLAPLNIKVNIKKVSSEEAVGLEFGSNMKDGQRPYDMAIFEWYSDFPDPSGVITPIYLGSNWGEGGSNSACYENKEVDKLLREQGALSGEAERTDILFKALDIINDEAPLLPYTHPNYLWGASKRLDLKPEDLTTMWIWNEYIAEFKLAQ